MLLKKCKSAVDPPNILVCGRVPDRVGCQFASLPVKLLVLMKKGQKGINVVVSQNSTLRPKLHIDATKRLLEQYMS